MPLHVPCRTRVILPNLLAAVACFPADQTSCFSAHALQSGPIHAMNIAFPTRKLFQIAMQARCMQQAWQWQALARQLKSLTSPQPTVNRRALLLLHARARQRVQSDIPKAIEWHVVLPTWRLDGSVGRGSNSNVEIGVWRNVPWLRPCIAGRSAACSLHATCALSSLYFSFLADVHCECQGAG